MSKHFTSFILHSYLEHEQFSIILFNHFSHFYQERMSNDSFREDVKSMKLFINELMIKCTDLEQQKLVHTLLLVIISISASGHKKITKN